MKSHAQRIEDLRTALVDTKEGCRRYSGQRLYHFLQALEHAPSCWSTARRLAAGVAGAAANAEPIVTPEELLVGYHYCATDDGEVNLENAGTFGYIADERDRDRLERYLREGLLSEEQIVYVLQRSYRYRLFDENPPSDKGEAYAAAERDGACVAWCCSQNHTVLGYERVVREGFSALAEQIEARLKDPALNPEQEDELQAMLLYANGGIALGRRYADRLGELAAVEPDPDRRAELLQMQAVCARVPAQGATSFWEAVQSLWFAHILNTWEDTINANSIGRLDQILYPYYRRDVDAGRLTREQAYTLLCYLWLKLYRDYDVQQVTLGGLTPDGQDAANELTYLMLDVTQALGFVRCLSVRLHRQSPPDLVRRALEVVGALQNGVPFFFNDDILVPALISGGIAPEDARGYAPLGCIEITIPGKSNPHAVSNRVNLLKCLEYALNDGGSMLLPQMQVGLRTGDAASFTFAQLLEAFYRQMEHITRMACAVTNQDAEHAARYMRLPYKSLLTDGCIESGRDFNSGGPTYDYYQSMPMAIPNVADALIAIRRLVFEQKRYTLAELIDAMRRDFPDEAMRLDFLNGAPKYGNDIDEVDLLAAEITNRYVDLLREIPGLYGPFFAQPFTYLWVREQGGRTAASADGRHAREPLAYSVSPMQGRDESGLTAALNSIAKIPAARCPASVSAILEVEPQLFAEENIELLTQVLLGAIDMGVGQIQFNVVTAETLRAAQREPDKYRSLAVRVSGFSQKFCLLDSALQDHIIARTKHAAL